MITVARKSVVCTFAYRLVAIFRQRCVILSVKRIPCPLEIFTFVCEILYFVVLYAYIMRPLLKRKMDFVVMIESDTPISTETQENPNHLV